MAPLRLTWAVGDFETASAIDLKKAGAWRYAEDPTTEILCFSFRHQSWPKPMTWLPWMTADDPVTLALRALVDEASDVMWIAHNAGFEKAIWRCIMVAVLGWPDIANNRWHDSMASCAMKLLPQDLDRAAIVLRLHNRKDREGSALVKSLSKLQKDGSYDRSTETLQRVADYCEQDVDTELDLHNVVGWLPPGERSVWLLDQRINERGVRLDLDFIARAQEVVDRASVPLAKEFATLTGGLKVTQGARLKDWCAMNGVDVPNMTKETLAALLGNDEGEDDADDDVGVGHNGGPPLEDETTLPDNVRRVLSIRRLIGSASIKKLRRMDLCVGSDGCARGLLQYHGAGPGRWAGRLLQPQNFPRGSLDRKALKAQGVTIEVIVEAILTGDPDWVEMVVGSPAVETIVSSLRHAIIAREGRRLVAGDFSTVELRVNLALARQADKLAMLRAKLDPYIDMAQLIYKRKLDKEANPEERQTGKNSVLGLGFQMGARKFLLKYGNGQDLEFCQSIVDTFRQEWAPKIPDNWYELEEAALRTVVDGTPHEAKGVLYALENGWMTARLPSGRKLWYPEPKKIRKAMPWDNTDIRLAWTYGAMKKSQWTTVDAYGGLLTENVVQGLARDLMVAAMFKCEKNGFPVVLTVHDEIVTEPLAADADHKALEQIMCDVPEWAKHMDIPVAAEAWVGDRYKK